VPADRDVGKDGETFTITVTFDTQELYGKVVGTRPVRIRRP
jgi:hypothetical protein